MPISIRIIALPLLSLLLLTAHAKPPPAAFDVTFAHGSQREQQAAAQLERVAAKYDLSKWIQTRRIVFEEGVIPHSYPVLTFNTRHLDDDAMFVSTFIHEQTHWWLDKHQDQVAAAIADLKKQYASLPVGYPEGADSTEASYEHLLVNCLELDGLVATVGEAEAQRILQFWSGDHYTKLYQIVGRDKTAIRAVLQAHGLML